MIPRHCSRDNPSHQINISLGENFSEVISNIGFIKFICENSGLQETELMSKRFVTKNFFEFYPFKNFLQISLKKKPKKFF